MGLATRIRHKMKVIAVWATIALVGLLVLIICELLQAADIEEPCSPPGFILGSGVLDAADHELDDGAVQIGGYTLFINRVSPPVSWLYVRQHRGQPMELVLRPVRPRTPQRLER